MISDAAASLCIVYCLVYKYTYKGIRGIEDISPKISVKARRRSEWVVGKSP
jgi:hypothetical protein